MIENLKINWTMIVETFVEIGILILFVMIAIPFIIIFIIPAAALTLLNEKNKRMIIS